MTAPALPSGWTATLVTGDPPTWATSTTTPDSAPNAAFVNDQDGISDKTLDSRNIVISGASVISFRNNYNTEYDPPPAEVFWDGYVLEVSINGGAFNDFTDPAVGGSLCQRLLHWGDRRDGEQPAGGAVCVVRQFRGLHQHGDQSACEPGWADDQAALPDGNGRSDGAPGSARGWTLHHQRLLSSVRPETITNRFFLTLCLPLPQGEADKRSRPLRCRAYTCRGASSAEFRSSARVVASATCSS